MTNVPFDGDAIRKLAAILTETGLTEIEIGDKDGRIRVARAPASVSHAVATPLDANARPAPPALSLPVEAAPHPGAVLSPMVGVAYLSPEPGLPPYVSVGQSVSAGQTLLLIEAMKTFNQIRAPKSGIVVQILVVSGGPVEYGEVLVIVE